MCAGCPHCWYHTPSYSNRTSHRNSSATETQSISSYQHTVRDNAMRSHLSVLSVLYMKPLVYAKPTLRLFKLKWLYWTKISWTSGSCATFRVGIRMNYCLTSYAYHHIMFRYFQAGLHRNLWHQVILVSMGTNERSVFSITHQLERGQATLVAVTLQMSKQLHGHRTYFLPGGAHFMGCKEIRQIIK